MRDAAVAAGAPEHRVQWIEDPSIVATGLLTGAVPQQALNAHEDQCAPADPRMPMPDDMDGIMRAAYGADPPAAVPRLTAGPLVRPIG